VISLADFESRIAGLEERLRPVAGRPVDITVPGWGERLVTAPHPLDDPGARAGMESLLRELIAVYRKTSEDVRVALRKFFEQYPAFAWAASLPSNPRAADGFREQLLLFSLKDQGRDSRDALLDLRHLCEEARAAE